MRDAALRGSVHETGIGNNVLRWSDDIATHEGIQRFTSSVGTAQIIVLDGTAYCSGTSTRMVSAFCGLSAKAAGTLGSRWLSVSTSTRADAALADDVTLASVLASITPGGTLTKTTVPTLADGKRAIGVLGTATADQKPYTSEELWISAAQPSLPIAVDLGLAHSLATTTIHSRDWGERVSLSAPTTTVALSSLTG